MFCSFFMPTSHERVCSSLAKSLSHCCSEKQSTIPKTIQSWWPNEDLLIYFGSYYLRLIKITCSVVKDFFILHVYRTMSKNKMVDFQSMLDQNRSWLSNSMI